MAEEESKPLAVPGNIFPNGKPSFSDKECDNDAYRESFSSGNNVEHSRRYSTGKPSSPKSNQKITPHYLIASTGSCHDLCKYGMKHEFEEIEKRPWMMKKVMLTSSDKHNCVGTVAPTELKKSPLPRSMSCPINISHLLQHETSSDAISSPRPHKIIKGEIMQPCKLIEVSSKQEPSSDRRVPKKGKGITDGSGEQSPVTRQPTSHDSAQSGLNTHKAEKKLNRSSQKSSPPLHSQRVKAGSSSSLAQPQPEKARLSSSMHLARPQPAKSRPSCSMQTAGSIKETAAISSEALKSSKIISKIPRSIQTTGGANGINKRRVDEKISEANVKLSPSSLTERNSMERGKKRDDVLTRKNMPSVGSSSKKRLASPGSSLSSRPCIGRKTAMEPGIVGSLKLVSSLKDQNRMIKKEIRKTSDEHVPEKILHVVEIETKPKHSESTEVKDIIPPLPPQSNISLLLPSLQVMSLSSHEEVGGVEKEVVVDENGIHREDEIKLEAEEKESEEEEEKHIDEHEVEQKEEKEHLEKKEGEVEQEEEKEDEVEQEEEDEEEEEEEEEEEQQQQLEEEEKEMEEGEDNDDDDDDDDYEEEENVHESDEGDESIIGNKTVNYYDLRYVISDSGDSVQVKQKFRRGKVLDIHSENKASRRLRFRQARIVEENHGSKNEISRRNFNRRYSRKANSDNTSDQKIVLRHQDLQGKKDAQGLLLNNVIGETASKLVESRKSKVKALVGAFETVISLHDRKPSAQLAA